MIQWIRNRRWNKRRLIFRYHDGRRQKSADPVEVAMALHSHPTFLYRHLIDAAEGDAEAQRIVADTACDVFRVEAFRPGIKGGLTIAERIELIMAFDLYLMALKKNINPSPTLPFSTESTSNPSEQPATNDTSGSGSTESDLPSDPPTSTATVL